MSARPAPRWPEVRYCRCGRTAQEHKFRCGRAYSDWLAAGDPDVEPPRGGTDDGTCAGFELDRVEERPDEGELRRRLAEIEAMHRPDEYKNCRECNLPHPCGTVRLARGETPEGGAW